MNNNEDAVKMVCKVEQLREFPFQSFAAYKKAVAEGQAKASVDKLIAVQWTRNGIHSFPGLRRQIVLLIALIPFSVIAFIGYAIYSRHWMLFLALPFLWFGSTLLILPGNAIIITILLAGLAWGLAGQIGWLIALALPPLVYWFANRTIDRQAVAGLAEVIDVHEDLFCQIWGLDGLRITLANGNQYCSAYKQEGGKFVSNKKDS